MSAANLWQAGYRDLVCVIPPKAEIAPNSKIKLASRGKVPGKQRLDGRWTGYPWLTQPATAQDIRQWHQWGANVGIHGAHFPGLDIDSEDAQLTQFIMQEALRKLGPAPIRTSRPPRRLLVYRTSEPFPRVRATVVYKGAEHVLEMLGQGRQYLVYGQHPSGSDYGWEGKPLWQWAPDDLTEVTQENVEAFIEHLRKLLKGRAEVRLSVTEDAAPPNQDDLRAPSIDALREIVDNIPNDYADRDTYVQVGYAIKAAAGQEHEADALEMFTAWAGRWEGGDNSPETVAADWSGMHPPYRLGWAYLLRMASDRGAAPIAAAQEFDADPDAPPIEASDYATEASETDLWIVRTVAKRVADRVRYLPETECFHTWSE